MAMLCIDLRPLNFFSAGTVFRRQNLMCVSGDGPRAEGLSPWRLVQLPY